MILLSETAFLYARLARSVMAESRERQARLMTMDADRLPPKPWISSRHPQMVRTLIELIKLRNHGVSVHPCFHFLPA